LFGQYKRLKNSFEGVLTGKNPKWGGSLIRPEATGYGTVYFAANMMAVKGETLEGKRVAVSGSGNVAQYATEKVLDLGGKPVTLSDSTGFIIDNDGITREKLAWAMDLKNVRRGRIKEYAEKYRCEYYADYTGLWKSGKYDVALPSATQNELNGEDAQALLDNGCTCVAEGANMPSTPEAVDKFVEAGIFYGPGKAANAGGVAVSGLEMAQNAYFTSWSREEVDNKLKDIMQKVHDASYAAAEEYGTPGNYVNGANIAGFVKVADAMIEQGLV
ncbi:glutamate dehydrogenase, partial [bacterium]|nr:glutamate dehydrogenase [bacterium]